MAPSNKRVNLTKSTPRLHGGVAFAGYARCSTDLVGYDGMKVGDVIAWLRTNCAAESAVRVEVIPAPADETGQRLPVPVIGVSVDSSDREVHLLTNSPPWAGTRVAGPVTVAWLLQELAGLPKESLDFSLVSGTWCEIDAEHVARRDWPFEGIASNADETALAFVEAAG